MGKCTYVYKGREFNSDRELYDALIEDRVELVDVNTTNRLVISGDERDLEFKEAVLRENAIRTFGTDEFISVTEKDGKRYVNVDQQAIDDITSGQKRIKNLSTGEMEDVNLDTLAKEYERTGKAPNYEHIEEHLEEHFMDKAIEATEKRILSQKDPAQPSLESRLTNFANRLGITVTTLENYMANFKLRTGEGAKIEALADMMRRIIAISNNDTAGQLTEEVAHFAIEYADDQQQIDDMLDRVDQTTLYQQEAGKYRVIYAKGQDGKKLSKEALERKVRKEVLGKILAQKIEDNFNTTGNNVFDRIINGLKSLWDQMLGVFKVNDSNRKFFKDFGQVLDQLAEDVVDGNTANFRPRISNEVYFSAMTTEEQIFHNTLSNHVEQLKQGYLKLTNSSKDRKDIRLSKLRQITDELSNLSYYTALNSYLSVLSEDVNGAKNTIETAKSTDPSDFTKAIDNVDLQNLNNFITGVKPAMEAIRRFIKSERRGKHNSIVSDTDLMKLEARIEGIEQNFNSIQKDLDTISEQVFLNTAYRIIDEFVPIERLARKIKDTLDANLFKDVNGLVKYIFSAFNVGNPIFQLATAVYKKADTRIRRRVNSYAERLREIQRNKEFSPSDIKTLYDDYHMISPFHFSKWEEAYEKERRAVREKYAKQIDEIEAVSQDDRLEQESELLRQRDLELVDLMFEWETPQFKREYYTKMAGLRPETTQIIINRTIARNKVFNKYRGRDGKVRFELIASSDLVKLQEAQRYFKSQMATYYEDGTAKEGLELRIANELREYFESSDFSNEKIQFEEFEKARLSVLHTFGENSKEYQNWLGLYANITYTQEEFDQFEGAEVIESLALDIEDVFSIKNQLGIPETQDATMQELYDGLIKKRRELVAPYKKVGKFNEIDGNQIETNEVLKEELERIREHLRKFTTEDREGGVVIKSMGNRAYREKIQQLRREGKTRQLQDFLRRHSSRFEEYYDRELGEYVPTPNTYHYRTFEINNRPPNPQPNYLWIERDTDHNERNPEYNMAFKGKTKMPNKNKTEYINDNYFEHFGIDKESVLGTGATTFGTATKNKDLWELRQFLLDQKEQDDKAIGHTGQYFLLPQVRGDLREVYTGGINTIKATLKDSFLLEGDDELGRNLSVNRVGGDNNPVSYQSLKGSAMIPRYYTQKLRKHQDLTKNISKMYGQYHQMAVNYEEKSAILPTMQNFRNRLATSSIEGGKRGEESNLLKMLDSWLENVMYGQTHNPGGVVKIGQYEISTTKTLKSLYRWISTTNLGFNAFVPVIGYFNATLTKRLEGLAGNDTTTESMNWANKEFIKHMPTYANDMGSISPNNKIKKLFEFTGVNMNPGEIYDGVFNSRGFRLNKDWAYKHYEMAGTATGAHAILSILDNYRLVNGRFISFKNFRELEQYRDWTQTDIKNEWANYKDKSYYNYLKEDKHTIGTDRARLRQDGFDGDFDALDSRMARNAQEFHDKIEGLVGIEDRAMIQRHTALMFFAMHRGWLQSAIQQRFKRRQVNMFTGAEEEGNYRTIFRLLGDKYQEDGIPGAFGLLAHVISFGAYRKGIEGLEEFERANLRRLHGDGVAYFLGLALFLLANLSADDDEEDYFKQYMGYIASRGFSEVLATIPLTSAGQIYEIALSPLAGVGMLEDIVNFPAWAMDLRGRDAVKSGAYAGMQPWQKEVIRKTPIKNIFEPLNANARKSNIFFRNKVLPLPNQVLDAVENTTNNLGITDIE